MRAEGNPVPRRGTRPLSACQAPDPAWQALITNPTGRNNYEKLTREIHTLTTELHSRLLDEPAQQP